MYFVIIAAFAVLLSDGLPPPEWNAFSHLAAWTGRPINHYHATLALVLLQIVIVAGVAAWVTRRALRARDGTPAGDLRSEDRYSTGGLVLAGAVFTSMMVCM